MTAPEHDDYPRLLAAHLHRELPADDAEQLAFLASLDAGRCAELAEQETLLGLLDEEVRLRDAVLAAPRAPAADDVDARLDAAAEAATVGLRARILAETPATSLAVEPRPEAASGGRVLRPAVGWRRIAAVAALAAAVLLMVLLLGQDDAAPDLDPRVPGAQTLDGSATIRLRAEISRGRPVIAWDAFPGAESYDVRIEDEAGREVLHRPEALSRSTSWELSDAQLDRLDAHRRQHAGGLVLRVHARSLTGDLLGSSGALPLSLR